jgi:hypothetical protein
MEPLRAAHPSCAHRAVIRRFGLRELIAAVDGHTPSPTDPADTATATAGACTAGATAVDPTVADPAATTVDPKVTDPAATTVDPKVTDPAATTERASRGGSRGGPRGEPAVWSLEIGDGRRWTTIGKARSRTASDLPVCELVGLRGRGQLVRMEVSGTASVAETEVFQRRNTPT